MDDVEKRIREFDVFYDSQVSPHGYLTSLELVGGDSKAFKRVQKKLGIPVVSFYLDVDGNGKDVESNISREDEYYFEKFRSHVTLFPDTRWILNDNKTLFNLEDLSRGKMFSKGRFQHQKKYDEESNLYRYLCDSKIIDFGIIELPFSYLWENKGERHVVPNRYSVNAGKNLRLNLSEKNISFT